MQRWTVFHTHGNEVDPEHDVYPPFVHPEPWPPVRRDASFLANVEAYHLQQMNDNHYQAQLLLDVTQRAQMQEARRLRDDRAACRCLFLLNACLFLVLVVSLLVMYT